MILMVDKKLLKDREEKKARTPTFKRHAAHRKKKLGEKWRKPKGLHNKLRLNKKSRGTRVRIGYRVSEKVRGLSKSGKKQLVVSTKKELMAAEPEMHAIIIAGTVGDKRRLELLEEATKQGFEILNLDAKQKTDAIKERLSKRVSTRKERTTKKEAREKEAKKKEEKAKKAEETELSDDEKKVQEKKEQDKILTQKSQN